MRLDLFGVAANSIATDGLTSQGAGSSQGPRQPVVPAEDTATLSAGSLTASTLATQALLAAEARYAKVDALQRAVSSGAYTLDPSLIAEALINAGV